MLIQNQFWFSILKNLQSAAYDNVPKKLTK